MAETQVISPLDTFRARIEATGRECIEKANGWINTSCPVTHNHKHNDMDPSFGFREIINDTDDTDRKVIFNCFNGCSKKEILDALEMKEKDLYSSPDGKGLGSFRYSRQAQQALTLKEYSDDKLLPLDFLMIQIGLYEGIFTFHKADGTPYKLKGVAMPYAYPDGKPFERVKLRTALKKTGRLPHFLWSEGDEALIAYGQEILFDAKKASFLIIVEGESDWQTLRYHGYCALGIPGANSVKNTLDASMLDGISKIYVLQEKTDQAGQNFPFEVQRHLRESGFAGEILRVPLKTLTEAKDPSDLHKQLWNKDKPRDHECFREEFQKALDQAKPMNYDTASLETLPSIITNNAQLRDITRETMGALHTSTVTNERLYVHFSQLSRVVKNEDGRPIVQQMSVASLKGELSEAANFFRTRKAAQDEVELVSVSPPNEIAEQILALPPSDWKFPSLKGVTEVPLVKPDGTLLDIPGYDKKLKVFYDPSDDLKELEIPEYCTQEDAINAAKVLQHLIAEFPFEGEADRANMIGLFLTPFIRHAFKGDIQLALLDATNPGTGKTFLAQIAAIIATGARTEARSQKGDDDEWRKFILAVLLKCPQIVLIDNVRGTLASVSLEAALTSETISDRLLGVSKDVSATNTALWIATGNNLLIGGDLSRRCFRIRLVANNANPDERDDYAIPEILDYCEDHRRELVAAILIMIKAWFQAGKPPAKAKIAKADSFGNWIKMIGGILEFAGIQGWQKNREELRSKNNEEAKEWERFLSAWSQRYGEAWKKTLEVQKDIIDGCPHSHIADGDSQLFEALPNLLAEKFAKNKDSFYLSLAKALSFRKQTVYGQQGFQIESKDDSHAGGTLWKVTMKNDPENKPPQTPFESNSRNGSTSGSRESSQDSAEVCGGSTPFATEKKSNSKSVKSDVTSLDSLHNNSADTQGVQTSANLRSHQNGRTPKVVSGSSTSAVNAVFEQPPESPVCGGSFSKAESDEDLLSDYRTLYQRVGQTREKLAPLGTLHWYVPDSGYPTGLVEVDEYKRRLQELYRSNEHHKILVGLEEMRRKLGGIQ
jgi:hypothetical protein